MGELILFATVIYWALTVLVNFLFSGAVMVDAGRLSRADKLRFVDPWVWSLATLMGGVVMALAYWGNPPFAFEPASFDDRRP